MRFARLTSADAMPLAVLTGVVFLLFGPLIAHLLLGDQPRFDHYWHLELARGMVSDRTIHTPHFLFQLLVIALEILVGDYARAGVIVLVASYAVLTVILYVGLRSSATPWMSALATLALLLIAPIPLLAAFDGHFYFGYISAGSIYHNPTILLLKPLAILLFVWSTRFFVTPFRSSVRAIVIVMAAVILSAVAKPSYLICLLPVLLVMTCYRLARKKPVDLRALLVGIMLPATCILGWQYLKTYASGQTSIAFAPLLVAGHFSHWLLPKFGLSIAFPLVVTGVFFRRAMADLKMRLAWAGAILGILCFYCLIETDPAITFHGNFGWSAVITLFVLFFAATVFLLEQWEVRRGEATGRWPLVVSVGVLCLHVIGGALWYALMWSSRPAW